MVCCCGSISLPLGAAESIGVTKIPMISNVFTASATGTIASMHHTVGVVEVPVKLINGSPYNQLEKVGFFVSGGKISEDFYATPESPYFKEADAKKYIDIYEYAAGKVGVQITDKPTCVFTRNAELGIWVANVAGGDYYLGTYKTYNTISASKTSYINAENKGVSQFPCDMVTIEVVA